MGIMTDVTKFLNKMNDKKVQGAVDTLVDAFGMTSRGTEAIRPSTAETVFNGPNSLARRLFESSHEGARWDNIVMNKGKEDEWRLSGRRVAAGFVGASSLGRLASGGGIYKDADGNTDIIGIPFI